MLWALLGRFTPGASAICLMPDHAHLLHERDVAAGARQVARSYARWRNARRGEQGPVFRPLGEPTRAVGATKRSRDLRYIHLNPCRAGLVADPLTWAFSTHRDAVGLAAMPVCARARDASSLHRYV